MHAHPWVVAVTSLDSRTFPLCARKGARMKVLIAEDNLASRIALAGMLSDWGFDVQSACDGIDAWKQLQADQSPRLLILDWMMPGLDGLELCRRIRHSALGPAYLILLTARDEPEDIVVGLEEG